MLCYDITNYQSFQDLEDWYQLVLKTFEGQNMPMPRITLVGNKTDLNHLRTVKVESHNKFADENEMFSCFMSAKSGDNVAQAFYRVAADLAGVVLTKPELEVASKVVRAEIINHPQDRAADDTAAEGRKKAGGGGGCTVQ